MNVMQATRPGGTALTGVLEPLALTRMEPEFVVEVLLLDRSTSPVALSADKPPLPAATTWVPANFPEVPDV